MTSLARPLLIACGAMLAMCLTGCSGEPNETAKDGDASQEAGAAETAPPVPCTSLEDCLSSSNGDLACIEGFCADCATDADCGAGRCKQQRCYACLQDADCPPETPRCGPRQDAIYYQPAPTKCYCDTTSQCGEGTYCRWAGIDAQGGDCIPGNCATSPGGIQCQWCLENGLTSDCSQCNEAEAAYQACAQAVGNCYADDCCTGERTQYTTCLRACVGDDCD